MSRLTRMVSATERMSDPSRQPGMKRTCVRVPGRLLKTNTWLPAGAYLIADAIGDRAVAADVLEAVLSAFLPVRLAAAGLGQSAADHVADGQQGDEQPDLVSGEVVSPALLAFDRVAGEQNAHQHDDVGEELSRLESGLGLCRQTTDTTA